MDSDFVVVVQRSTTSLPEWWVEHCDERMRPNAETFTFHCDKCGARCTKEEVVLRQYGADTFFNAFVEYEEVPGERKFRLVLLHKKPGDDGTWTKQEGHA